MEALPARFWSLPKLLAGYRRIQIITRRWNSEFRDDLLSHAEITDLTGEAIEQNDRE